MRFLPDLRRVGVRVLAPLVAVSALLAACGGGSSQVQSFKPARLLVVGDETGLIVDDGSHDGFKYGLNDRTATTAGKCLQLPTPAQQVAAQYGFVFAACNPANIEAKAFALGKIGALADDAVTGVKAQLDSVSSLGGTDLVLVTVGTNDILQIYEQRKAGTWTTDALALAEATRRGAVVAAQVNRVLGTGARAVVFTTPVMGKSPYAISAGATAAKLITDLTTAFNTALRLGIDSTDFDGRNYGLVLADDVSAAIEKFATSYLASPANKTEAQCAAANVPQNCLVVTGAVAPAVNMLSNTHLWATDRFLGPVANNQIGSQALSRVINNPF